MPESRDMKSERNLPAPVKFAILHSITTLE